KLGNAQGHLDTPCLVQRIAARQCFMANGILLLLQRNHARSVPEKRSGSSSVAKTGGGDTQFETRTRHSPKRARVTIHTTGEEVDPGNLQSRWAPYVRTHGSGQGQLPSRSIRPRGYVSPAGKRRPSTPI